MDLLVVRHGQSEADLLGVHEGRADYPLTGLGELQANAMARWVCGQFAPQEIYCSPLRRALRTAEILGFMAGVDLTPMESLMEWDNGLLAGLPYAEAERRYPRMANLPFHRSRYGCESMLDFRFRAERTLLEILHRSRGLGCVAIVSHGGTIAMLHRAFCGLPVTDLGGFPSGDTAVHIWRVESGKRRQIVNNSLEHLSILFDEDEEEEPELAGV